MKQILSNLNKQSNIRKETLKKSKQTNDQIYISTSTSNTFWPKRPKKEIKTYYKKMCAIRWFFVLMQLMTSQQNVAFLEFKSVCLFVDKRFFDKQNIWFDCSFN